MPEVVARNSSKLINAPFWTWPFDIFKQCTISSWTFVLHLNSKCSKIVSYAKIEWELLIFVLLNEFLPRQNRNIMRFLLACLRSLISSSHTLFYSLQVRYFTFQCRYCLEKAWRHCSFDLPSLFPNPFIPDRRRMWNSSSVSLKTALVWEGGDVIGGGMDAWTILEPAWKLPGIQPPPLLIQLVAQALSLIKLRVSVWAAKAIVMSKS